MSADERSITPPANGGNAKSWTLLPSGSARPTAVGLEMIPVEAATAKAIPVANMPGVNSESVTLAGNASRLASPCRLRHPAHDVVLPRAIYYITTGNRPSDYR